MSEGKIRKALKHNDSLVSEHTPVLADMDPMDVVNLARGEAEAGTRGPGYTALAKRLGVDEAELHAFADERAGSFFKVLEHIHVGLKDPSLFTTASAAAATTFLDGFYAGLQYGRENPDG